MLRRDRVEATPGVPCRSPSQLPPHPESSGLTCPNGPAMVRRLSFGGFAVTAACPECRHTVTIPDDASPGELLVCERCGVELELLSLDPPKVALFEEEEK